MFNILTHYKEQKNWKLALMIGFGILLLLILLPEPAIAAMDNNLTNEACLTCHTDYPAIKYSSSYTIKHKWDNCGTCHTDKATDSMWNCRYCHYHIKFKGGSSYWLHKSPTLSEGMNRHSWDGSLRYVDATLTYHNNNMATKHSSTADTSCFSCHNSSLTEEHNGGVVVTKENFEDTTYNFTFSGGWYQYSTFPFTGTYSFRSPSIPDNSSTSMETTVPLAEDGKISFWYRVSSEANYDKLYFYLDGVEKLGGISGNVGWCQVSFPLTAGTHTLKWTYVKDAYTKWFEDCVCIDDIVIYKGGRALDCNTCHLSTNTTVKNAIAVDNTNCSACHPTVDHETVHNTTLATDCSECHIANLSNEHKARKDEQGNYYTCDTCHKSTDPVVVGAIANRQKECSVCHGPINHDLPHASGMDSECLKCHTQYLNTDHEAFNVTCSQCHNSTVTAVSWAVQTKDKYCGACHTASHGVPLDNKYASDIPLYTGYSWSTPMLLTIWQGEAWVPTNIVVTGKVLVSNHRSDLTSDTVWNYYKTEMAANGWTLNSIEPATGVQEFKVEYSKNGRTCILWFHNKEDHLNAMSNGSRLEIIYN